VPSDAQPPPPGGFRGGNIINANNCTFAEVSAKVGEAQNGDTVVVPACDETWGAGQTLSPSNKAITIKGAGIDQTVIRRGTPGSRIITWNTIPGTPPNHLSRITGFTFHGTTGTNVKSETRGPDRRNLRVVPARSLPVSDH
jgi:hypothetical protein